MQREIQIERRIKHWRKHKTEEEDWGRMVGRRRDSERE